MNTALQTLLSRRSTKAAELLSPAPSEDDVERLLTAASRVPDHGRLVPFRFVVFDRGARDQFGDVIAGAFKAQNPNAPEEKLAIERGRINRAPLVIAVISHIRQGKHPQWEQILTAGAVCQNLLLGCEAMGYGAQWLTEWFAYDDAVRDALGCNDRETVAGFIHIGTKPDALPEDRERPDLCEIVTRYGDDDTKYGDCYEREKFDVPRAGFKTPKS